MAEAFLRTLRSLVTCYQAFGAYSAAHVRQLGLTPPQFDVLATLGNTEGMSCRELGERTLITKGTLTGVLDRLEARRLLRRTPSEQDRRSVFVQLTPAGEALFAKVFPSHMGHLRPAFTELNARELETLEALLGRLTRRFVADGGVAEAPSPKGRMIAASHRTTTRPDR
jgi:DNA-binding MarR family transcriptional regulator